MGWKRRSRSTSHSPQAKPASGLTDAELKHLEFIEGVITRQAGYCFLIKGWALTIAVAVFGFAIDRTNWEIAALGLGPVLVFAWLDAYFFRQERLYRCLYDAVVSSDNRVTAFSMNARLFADNRTTRWRATFKSPPYTVLYAALVGSGLIIIVVLASIGKP